MVVDVQMVVVVLTLSHRSGDPYQKGGCGGDKDEGSRALVPVNGTQVHTNRHKQAQTGTEIDRKFTKFNYFETCVIPCWWQVEDIVSPDVPSRALQKVTSSPLNKAQCLVCFGI